MTANFFGETEFFRASIILIQKEDAFLQSVPKAFQRSLFFRKDADGESISGRAVEIVVCCAEIVFQIGILLVFFFCMNIGTEL